jgi:two-component SAPR family response regulator
MVDHQDLEIVIDPDYRGPSILECRYTLDAIEDEVVNVRWTNTKPEFYLLQQYRGKKKFRLYVQDLTAQERAASFLGQRLPLDKNLIETAKLTIASSKSYNWREYVNSYTPTVACSVLTKIAADALRDGRELHFIKVAKDCLLDGLNPADADVLFRLRVLRGN